MYCRLLDQISHILYKIWCRSTGETIPSVLPRAGLTLGMPIQEAVMTRAKYAVDVSVIVVEFHKMDQPPYHEFMVFTVEEDGPRRRRATIAVDRYVGDDVPMEWLKNEHIPIDTSPADLMYKPDARPGPEDLADPIDHRPVKLTDSQGKPRSISSPVEGSGSSFSIDAATTVSPEKPLHDFVTLIVERNSYLEQERKGSELCKIFHIQKEIFSVAELLQLVYAIHGHNETFHLLRYQCHWLADTLYNTVKMRCGDVEESLVYPEKLGKFGNVHVQHINDRTPEIILKVHMKGWATWGFKRRSRRVHHVTEAMRKTDDAGQQAHEADERADEANKRADEARKWADEAGERVKAAKQQVAEAEKRAEEAQRQAAQALRQAKQAQAKEQEAEEGGQAGKQEQAAHQVMEAARRGLEEVRVMEEARQQAAEARQQEVEARQQAIKAGQQAIKAGQHSVITGQKAVVALEKHIACLEQQSMC